MKIVSTVIMPQQNFTNVSKTNPSKTATPTLVRHDEVGATSLDLFELKVKNIAVTL